MTQTEAEAEALPPETADAEAETEARAAGEGDGPQAGSGVLIRRMRLPDIEHVSRLERRCYTLPWSSSAYVTEVGNPSAYYVVATDADGVVIGYAGMWVVMDEMHITTIAVDPGQRGRRVGERLLLDLTDEGVRRGASRATLEVRERNAVARALYRKYGFEDVAVRKNYYSDNGENALIMWANDLTRPPYQAMLAGFRAQLASQST